MTCIIGYEHNGKAYIGADSLGSNGWTKAQYDTPKLFKAHGMVIGYTTTYRFGQILQYHLAEQVTKDMDPYQFLVQAWVPHVRELLGQHGAKGKEKDVEFGGNAVIGYRGKVYELQGDFSILKPSNGVVTVGSGEQVAYGAMLALANKDPRAKIRRALDITAEAVVSVGGRTSIMEVPA